MERNLTFFQGNTQYSNTGDALINKSLLEHLRKYSKLIINDKMLPQAYIEEINLKKEEKSSSYNYPFLFLVMYNGVLSLFNGKKIFFIAGPPGHQFGNTWTKTLKGITMGLFLSILRLLNVKIIKIGFSIGPFDGKVKFSERFRALFINHYLVRDSISLELAKEIGIKKANFFPDLAWSFKPSNLELNLNESKTILFSFRCNIYGGSNNENDYYNKLVDLIDSILQVLGHNYKIVLTYQVKEDYDFATVIYDKFKENLNISLIHEQINLDNANMYYHPNDLIITNRLHGGLLANKYGALPIFLTDFKKHVKIKGILVDANLEEIMLDINHSNKEIVDHIIALEKNKEMILEKMKNITQEYSNFSDQLLQKIYL